MTKATESTMSPFPGDPEVQADWPSFESNFYWDESNEVWVYKYADERIVAAVEAVHAD